MENMHEPVLETMENKPVKKASAKKKKNEDISFEAALSRLEEIVRLLERDTEPAPLDQSLKLYEEGVSLVRRCAGELDAAEQKVKILQRTQNGEIKPAPFASTHDPSEEGASDGHA